MEGEGVRERRDDDQRDARGQAADEGRDGQGREHRQVGDAFARRFDEHGFDRERDRGGHDADHDVEGQGPPGEGPPPDPLADQPLARDVTWSPGVATSADRRVGAVR